MQGEIAALSPTAFINLFPSGPCLFFTNEPDGLEDPAVSVQYLIQKAPHELAKVFNCDLLKKEKLKRSHTKGKLKNV